MSWDQRAWIITFSAKTSSAGLYVAERLDAKGVGVNVNDVCLELKQVRIGLRTSRK